MFKLFALRSFRPPDQQPDRRACNWMLASAALAIGFHYEHLPLWLSAFSACLLLWRYFIENHAWRIPGRVVRWSLLLLTGVIVFRHYGTILGRDAGVAYLTLLVALKILEIRSLRDYLLAVFLIYLLVLGALLFSQSLPTGAFAALVMLVTTQALVLLNRPQALSQLQSFRVVVVVVLQAVPLLLVLYFLFPRIQGSLWGLPQDAYSGRTGMSEQVSPGSISRLYNDDTIAFRAEFNSALPPPAALYWRTFVLSDTDGRTWQRHQGPGDGAKHWDYRAKGPTTEYTITLEPHNQRWLPALDLPVKTAESVITIPGFALEATRRVHDRRSYTLASHLRYTTGPLSEEASAHNLLWPRTPSSRVRQLIGDWQRTAATPLKLVEKSLEFFSEQPFHYTLTPPLLTGDPLDEFLFETRAGYCEHYATVFVALMRLSNIPARLVVGYQGGEWNETGRYLITRQSDAHAWAEVWLPRLGWVRVDPTAAVAPERIELGANALRRLTEQGAGIGLLSIDEAQRLIAPSWARRAWRGLSWRWDEINNGWNRWVMAYGPNAQRQLLKLFGITTPNWIGILATMAVSVALLLLLISAVWMVARRKTDPVVLVYQKFCAKLKRAGLERGATEGPVDYAHRLINDRPDLRDPINQITNIYVKLRYGRFSASGMALLRRRVADLKVSSTAGVRHGGV